MSGLGQSINRVTDDDKLKGVRGCLLLPAVIVVMVLLRLVFLIGALIITRFDSGALLWLVVALNVLIAAFGALALTRLMQERKLARILMIVFFGLLAAVNAAGLFVDPTSAAPQFAAAVAVIIYFLVSKRVKVTLVN
jgi:hypothetical protein